jgi:hypothetical protein
MPGQFGEELARYGGKVAKGLKALKETVESGSKQLGAEVGKEATELGKELANTARALKAEGERGIKWLDQTGVPAAKEKLGHAAQVVATHADLTGRRIAAEALELAKKPEILEKDKARNFELVTLLFNRKVSLFAPVRTFLQSEHAKLEGLDNSGEILRGVTLYPQQKALPHLKNEFVPVRIYITAGGLVARTYQQASPEEVCEGKPQYTFVGERKASADDLFQLRITPDQLGGALGELYLSNTYQAFRKEE